MLALLGLIPSLVPLFLGYLSKKTDSGTESEKTVASALIAQMNARRDVTIAEQGHWYTALIRPLMATPLVIYLWKIIVWDKVLKLGTTDPITGDGAIWVSLMIGFYFGVDGLTQVARIIRNR